MISLLIDPHQYHVLFLQVMLTYLIPCYHILISEKLSEDPRRNLTYSSLAQVPVLAFSIIVEKVLLHHQRIVNEGHR